MPSAYIWLETIAWITVAWIITRNLMRANLPAIPPNFQGKNINRLYAALFAFFVPALAEELVFRVLLLPDPVAPISASWFAQLLLALLIFVIWHPLQAWTFRPRLRSVFTNPVFLTLALGLGFVCVALYLRSGSIWPAVLAHWFAVLSLFIFPQSSTNGLQLD